ncbi:sigma-70 family RNA polymerase sigma factor [Psychromonas sp. KJ10-10]|uniref:sigma-70 family RNA polymerase sigma factor n=1 Tax=Psychromonas sp. KJ10-10 TaxID=3391823 RepID=UPI0039B40F5E
MLKRIANSTGNILMNQQIDLLDEEQQQINDWLTLVARQQDQHAFSQLFKFFAPRIRSHGLKKFTNEAQAMELVQETMMLVWRKATQFNATKGKGSTWIYTIMRNYSFDMLRKILSNKEDLMSEDLWPMLDVEEETEDEDHLQTRHLFLYMDNLPDLQKQVIQGIYVDDKTQQELSDELSVPIGTIKSRLRLALVKLRDMMEEK